MSGVRHLMQHPRERASCVCPTRESCEQPLGCRDITFSIRKAAQTEYADSIALTVVLHEELVSIHDMFR